MKKCSRCGLAVILTALMLTNCTTPSIELLKTTSLPNYPSASALVMHREHLYVIGDDATQVLLIDKNHKIKDSIPLFKSHERRIGKDEKPDYESSFLTDRAGKKYLLAVGSFSTPKRCQLAWINLETNTLEQVDTLGFPQTGATAVNIEGSTRINQWLVLSNRANKSYPFNELLVTEWNGEKHIAKTKLRKIRITFPATKEVIGISDLLYYAKKDWLLFTASTENTANSYADGAIGDSYIGIIKNISKKLDQKEIIPDVFQNLKAFLGREKTFKIEALTVESETNGTLILHLAADNDNGESTLFKLRWKL